MRRFVDIAPVLLAVYGFAAFTVALPMHAALAEESGSNAALEPDVPQDTDGASPLAVPGTPAAAAPAALAAPAPAAAPAAVAPIAPVPPEASLGARPVPMSTKTFSNFAEVRAELLNAIGSATQRIWLYSEYLTDGEIVSALYVAQYRKIDVQVLLGRAKANHYMSRLSYLKNQNIPVYLRPDGFRPGHPSALLCDNQLVSVDGELDFLARTRSTTVTYEPRAATQGFLSAFSSAVSQKMVAVPMPTPLVGRGRQVAPRGRYGAAYSPASTPHYEKGEAAGSYTYDHHHDPRPDGVPAKLPKQLKWDRSSKARGRLDGKHPPEDADPAPDGERVN